MSRWYDAFTKKIREEKRNKFNAQRTESGFPSKLEEAVYAELLWLEKAGKYKDIERYATVHLIGKLKWKCDFKAFDIELNEVVYIEAKGVETERFIVIKQIWPEVGPGLLRVYRGKYQKPFLAEEIKGK